MKYRMHFLPHYLTVGYRHQAQLHTKQCKQSLQHKLDVPSVGLLSGAQSNLILPHFHQVETCTSKNALIISHQCSNPLWEFILWRQCLLGLHARTVSIYMLWWIGNKITKKNAAESSRYALSYPKSGSTRFSQNVGIYPTTSLVSHVRRPLLRTFHHHNTKSRVCFPYTPLNAIRQMYRCQTLASRNTDTSYQVTQVARGSLGLATVSHWQAPRCSPSPSSSCWTGR